MYAIIDDGGKQYKVAEGEAVEVDLRSAQPGEAISFEKVLLISGDDGATVGAPTIEGASVQTEVLGEAKGQKVTVQRFRRRQGMHRRKQGHRQHYTRVKITKIILPGQAAQETVEAAEGGSENGS